MLLWYNYFVQKKLDSSQIPTHTGTSRRDRRRYPQWEVLYIARVYDEKKVLTSNHSSNLVALGKKMELSEFIKERKSIHQNIRATGRAIRLAYDKAQNTKEEKPGGGGRRKTPKRKKDWTEKTEKKSRAREYDGWSCRQLREKGVDLSRCMWNPGERWNLAKERIGERKEGWNTDILRRMKVDS